MTIILADFCRETTSDQSRHAERGVAGGVE
jgi:hypothetical protein